MAREIRNFAVSVPPGTTQASPQVTNLTIGPRLVRRVRVRIPPGPAGTVGFALGSSGQRVIPWGAGEWIVGDNEILSWSLEDQIESGAWQLQAYNVGTYAHSLYVTFELDPVSLRGAVSLAPPLELEA